MKMLAVAHQLNASIELCHRLGGLEKLQALGFRVEVLYRNMLVCNVRSVELACIVHCGTMPTNCGVYPALAVTTIDPNRYGNSCTTRSYQVKADWSAPASWTEPARSGIPFPPGIHRDHFQRDDVKVFATEYGSNNKELIAHMLMTWIILVILQDVPQSLQDVPHCHGWCEELCQFCADNDIFIQFCADNDIFIVKFPHNSTTITQCLDVWFFKAFRKLYRKASENLRAAWEFQNGFLDMQMECCFSKK
jgi:hypothetical protein